MSSYHSLPLLLLCSALLPACSQDSSVKITEANNTDVRPASSLETVEDLMTTTIMPSSEDLWRAVSYVATENGISETAPQSDEDWAALRVSANALIAAGDALLNTDRDIFSSAFDPGSASFQLTPDEIRQMLADDPEPWRNYARQMQETTRMTLQAIEFRDLMGLVEFGAQINEACEGCHATYWYRPAGMMPPQ